MFTNWIYACFNPFSLFLKKEHGHHRKLQKTRTQNVFMQDAIAGKILWKKMKGNILNDAKKGGEDTTNSSNESTSPATNSSSETTSITNTTTT